VVRTVDRKLTTTSTVRGDSHDALEPRATHGLAIGAGARFLPAVADQQG
jgi:hypothetical protein